jgi:hypothetical protein
MKKAILIFLIPVVFLTSCDILEQVAQVAALQECEFELDNVSNIKVLGIRMDNKEDISDFSFSDLAKLTAALSSGSLPLEMDLNVKVVNPNTQTAAMTRMDWKVYVDEMHMVDGVVDDRVTIAPNGGSSMVPFRASVDLYEIISGEGLDAAINLAMNLSGKGTKASRLQLKIKPSINVAGRDIPYPGFVTVEQEISGS